MSIFKLKLTSIVLKTSNSEYEQKFVRSNRILKTCEVCNKIMGKMKSSVTFTKVVKVGTFKKYITRHACPELCAKILNYRIKEEEENERLESSSNTGINEIS